MRSAWMGLAVLVAVFLTAGCGSEKKESQAAKMSPPQQTGQTQMAMGQTTCPVMGGKINKNVYTDYNGKRIYFCCPSCIEEFKKDPEKYMQKMMDEGVQLQDSPMGEKMGGGMH